MGKILVLYYHKVCDIERDWNGLAVSPKTFRKQLEYIKENYQVLRADDDWKDCAKDSIIITFDDGYEDNYVNALPILEEVGIPATFFVSTEKLDTDEEMWCNELVWLIFEGNHFEKKFIMPITSFQFELTTDTLYQRVELYRILRAILPSIPHKNREEIMKELRAWGYANERKKRNTHKMMTSEELRCLAASDCAVIGAHTISHPSLGGLSYDEQFKEIQGSKNKLEEIIKKKITLFSYPFGGKMDYSDETISILKELGFEKAMTTESICMNGMPIDPYKIPRMCMGECDMQTFVQNLEDSFGLYRESNVALSRYPVAYVGKMEGDKDLWGENVNIVIWGAGGKCEEILNKLEKWNLLSHVKCIYDTSKNRIGSLLRGIRILNIEDHMKMENEVFIVAITQIGKALEQIQKYGLRDMHYYV